MKRILQSAILLVIIIACGEVKQKYELPIIGRSEVVEREVDGKTVYDTVYHTIDDF